MLWESEERDAAWTATLTDLYLSTSGLLRGATREAAALPLGAAKLCALHLRLEPRYAQWDAPVARLLCRGVLRLLAHVCAAVPAGQTLPPALCAAVPAWCVRARIVLAALTADDDDDRHLRAIVDALPTLVLSAGTRSSSTNDLCA